MKKDPLSRSLVESTVAAFAGSPAQRAPHGVCLVRGSVNRYRLGMGLICKGIVIDVKAGGGGYRKGSLQI